MKNIYWTESAEPKGTTLARVIYGLRSEADGDLLLDAVTEADIACEYDSVLSFDALVTPFAQLERRMNVLMRVMQRAAKTVTPVAVQIANPMKRGGAVHIPVIFELSDGQTITIFFHNPDTTPSRMAPSDELISWKWLLNKKDVTIVVAPEKGKDLHVQEVARRLMALADKNSAAFARANTRRAERLALIEANDKEIAELDGELERMNNEIQAAEIELEDSKRALAETREAAKKRAEEAAEAARKAQEEAERRAAEEKAAEEAAAQTATQPPAEEPAPEPTAEPAPEPAPEGNSQVEEDRKVLQSIIDKTHPLINAPSLLSVFEDVYARYDGNNDEMIALADRAVDAWAEVADEATRGIS